MLWGFENGLISTSDDGQFHADGTLTRAQAVTFISRAKQGKPSGTARSFADVKEGAWYFDAANWALENGLVGRDDSWRFNPNDAMTRAQLLTLIQRAYDPDAKKASPDPPNQQSFAALGISENVDDHGKKTFTTITESGEHVTFQVEVTDYRVFEDGDAYPKKDGYEYRIMNLKLYVKNSDQARTYKVTVLSDDYYNVKLFEDSTSKDSNGVSTHTVVCNGVPAEMTEWWSSTSENTADNYHVVNLTWTASVPKGYDGLVVGVRNREINSSGVSFADYYTSEADFALYRMN